MKFRPGAPPLLFLHTLEFTCCPCCTQGALVPTVFRTDDLCDEWIDGVLMCEGCGRWYRMEGGVADLVRDGLREVEEDRRFLRQWASSHEVDVARCQSPFAMEGNAPEPTFEDQKIIDEGRHWGRFMQHFRDVDDLAIFDLKHRGSHPPFYVAGILEPDDRDHRRPWGNFSPAAARAIFPVMETFRGARAVDVGCGGGQFALAAARAGVYTVGFDPSFQEVTLARNHARAEGIRNIDYFRAEPANPPFTHGAFHLMLAKDGLHHVPQLDKIFPRLLELMGPGSSIIIHEHVAHARRKEALMGMIRPRLINKIRSRYPKVEIPKELLMDSANEDVGAALIQPLMEKYFHEEDRVEELYLANELELLIHFAYGKRHWFSKPVYPIAMVLEKLLLLVGDRQHLTFVGKLKE